MIDNITTAQRSALAAYRDAATLRDADIFEAAQQLAHRTTVALVAELVDRDAVGTEIDTMDGLVTIARIDRRVDNIYVLMTTDGGDVNRDEWHDGDDDPADWAYYEAWTLRPSGRDRLAARSHGWAHMDSRKVVQAG